MSAKSRAGKAAWADRAGTYHDNLIDRITADARAQMDMWTACGRIPARVRIMARLAGRFVRLLDDAAQR